MSINEVVSKRRSALDRKIVENDLLQKQIIERKTKMLTASSALIIGQEALQFVEDVANSRRGAMRGKIEGIMSEALRLIYGTNYSVELLYDVKNNRSCLDVIVVMQTGIGEVKRTMEGFGGGVSDTIALPLRLLVLLGCRKTDLVCVIDEAYKHVGIDQVDVVGRFLAETSKLLGIQLFLCSHHETIECFSEKTFSVTHDGSRSLVSSN
jgi:hypothetical protein